MCEWGYSDDWDIYGPLVICNPGDIEGYLQPGCFYDVYLRPHSIWVKPNSVWRLDPWMRLWRRTHHFRLYL